ncbi:Hypothetical_protein [Hexamita inflata]|uniref:Hypothetical_protein n=1 Tax=Hexamita inflata TaxID=28002 RepID=A0AA86UP24_9EUKA|nr:Hypothetical protein HINF_LOCUS53685 [Hexamita inflata]
MKQNITQIENKEENNTNMINTQLKEKRWRRTDDEKSKVDDLFIQKINLEYVQSFSLLKDAVAYYQSCGKTKKTRFTPLWRQIDREIVAYTKKSYSYKYINEVVVKSFCKQWENDTKVRAKQYTQTLIQEYITNKLELTDTARRDIIQRTFNHFNNFSKEKVVGHHDTMKDMLNHFILSQIGNLKKNQTQKLLQNAPQQNLELDSTGKDQNDFYLPEKRAEPKCSSMKLLPVFGRQIQMQSKQDVSIQLFDSFYQEQE